jgi:anti-anti-sigma factor
MSTDGKAVTIQIKGRFDFKVHKEFRQVYEAQPPHQRYVVDLQDTEYLDSSALGMLLLLREHAGNDRADIHIVHCRPEIRQILTTANFHQLFSIA